MASIADTLRDAAMQLEAISDSPRLDAELLMAHALDLERGAMLLAAMQRPAPAIFGPLLLRRLAHEPVAYITGKAEFWSLPLTVTPDVLIPRGDSETLMDAALKHFGETKISGRMPRSILDLGTGSGALLLAGLCEWPEAQGLGIDRSQAALAVAAANADRLQLSDRAHFRRLDWRADGAFDALDQRFDLILCNPPYVETAATLAPQVSAFEPHEALFAGAEGLDDYHHLMPLMPQLLAPGGTVIFEIGASQAQAVINIAQQNGFISQLFHDLAGLPRALCLTR